MERIAFEDLPGAPNRFLLLRPKFVKVPPEFLDRAVLVIHASGGVSFNAVSIDMNRCWLKSSNASMKSCGISADSRMRCTRRSRSDLGKASISLNICSAVISTLTLAELFISLSDSNYPLTFIRQTSEMRAKMNRTDPGFSIRAQSQHSTINSQLSGP